MISFFINIRQSTRFILVFLYVICIAALSLLPMRDLPHVHEFPGFDKIVHFSMYFMFSFLFGWALKADHNYYWLLLIVPVTIGWGVFMEVLQNLTHQGRNFDFYDMVANSVGVVIGILFFLLLACKFSKS